VFANDPDLLGLIRKCFVDELSNYKLYLNPLKNEVRATPFITDIGVGKRELKKLIDLMLQNLVEIELVVDDKGDYIEVKKLKPIRNPYGLSNGFIKDFQGIVKRNRLTYDLLSKDIVRSVKAFLTKLFLKRSLELDEKIVQNYLLMLLDVGFYAYSLNINASTTFKIAQVIVLVCKFLDGRGIELRQIVFSKIFKEADFILTNFERKLGKIETNIETLNLLLALKMLDKGFQYGETRIRELFRIRDAKGVDELNYFQLMTLLYYFENDTKFSILRSEIESSVIRRFEKDPKAFGKAELTMMFFDFVTCPFVADSSKRKLILASRYGNLGSGTSVANIIDSIARHKRWFMDWDLNIDLERVLKKKEWGRSY
jgi:hypothetical protein